MIRPAHVVGGQVTAGVTPLDEHTCLLQTGTDSLHDLAAYLSKLDVEFDVLDPPELRTLLRNLANRYATAAQEVD